MTTARNASGQTIQINDRVESVTPDEDRDNGLVVGIEGDRVTVYWYDSAERTTQHADVLTVDC